MIFSRPGKPTWETKYVALHNNKIYVYNDSDELTSGIEAIEDFDLCPNNGVVTVQSAVSQTELVNVAAHDLPFILMVEFEPDAMNVPNRFLSFHLHMILIRFLSYQNKKVLLLFIVIKFFSVTMLNFNTFS